MRFSKLLIANRGEIACRIIATARRLGMQTVAVYSDADRGARHVAMADEAIHIGAAPVADSYLRIDRLLDAAKRTGAGAVHPGYGFLSERAEFAQAVADAGLVFVGPPAAAITAMGLKDRAKALMAEAGVPIVPGYHGDEQRPAELQAQADAIGFPVLIKARAGGGGKGMRLVDRPEDFAVALEGARREAQASFGDPHCLVEKFVSNPRHIELQVFADQHGNVVHLFERDCSLQRRHQKVIEEAPAPGMTPELRAIMGEAAVRAARAVDYVGAGTVEFIVDGSGPLSEDGFWFMEMNTRLQVEHPVTEAVTGLDLVALQLSVAQGQPLPFAQSDLSLHGHAVEARLYAEDPAAGFLPTTGTVQRLAWPESASRDGGFEPGCIRVDSGIREGDAVSPHYDPMIAKLVAHGPDRGTALRSLARALAGTTLVGVTCNRRFLQRLLEDEAVCAGELSTGFIEAHPALRQPEVPTALDWALAALTTLFGPLDARGAPRSTATGPLGGGPGAGLADELRCFRLFGPARHVVDFEALAGGPAGVAGAAGIPDGGETDAAAVEVVVTSQPGQAHQVQTPLGSVALTVASSSQGDGVRYSSNGAFGDAKVTRARVDDRKLLFVQRGGAEFSFALRATQGPGEGAHHDDDRVRAPMAGTVQQVTIAEGDQVAKGQALVVMAAMKMEHTLRAPRDGRVAALQVAVSDQVERGAVLVSLVPVEPA